MVRDRAVIRVIPTILFNGHGHVVKGRAFAADRVVGALLDAVNTYQMREVDELVLLDVWATREMRGPNIPLLAEVAKRLRSPCAIGGGIRSMADVDALYRAAPVDKVVIGTHVELCAPIAARYGRQAVMLSVVATAAPRACFVLDTEIFGHTGEVLIQSRPRDGTMGGYDIELVRAFAGAVTCPVIASGGCSGPEDMDEALRAGADAVAAGALFTFTDTTPADCKRYLAGRGWDGRA